MDVLNTYGGEFHVVLVVIAVTLGLLALLAFYVYITDNSADAPIALVIGLVLTFFMFASVANVKEPVRHEVTLRPGYIIDATKYEIVEQRGEIYVIEEREGSE